MRTAFASLILATGLAGAAQAQESAAPAAAEAAQTHSPAAAPATAEAAPAERPSLPSNGDGATVISLIERVCVPLVRGGDLNGLAKAAGMKKNRRDESWTMGLGGEKTHIVTIFPQGSNKDVCRGEVRYAVGQEKPMVSAINIWSFLHQPQLVLQANYVKVDSDGVKRVRKSWEHYNAQSSVAVNFSTLRKPDDSPLNGRYDLAEFFYQERKF